MVELPHKDRNFVFSPMRLDEWCKALDVDHIICAVNQVYDEWQEAGKKPGKEEWCFHPNYMGRLLDALKYRYAELVQETDGVEIHPSDCPWRDEILIKLWFRRRKSGPMLRSHDGGRA